MTQSVNANFQTEMDSASQAPVYYIEIDGLATKHYSTHPVKSAGTTKTVLMNEPTGGTLSVNVISGTRTTREIDVELIDVGDEITDLVATEATGAPLSTLINRKVTLYAGYLPLAEADYEPIFVGRIASVRMNRELTGYVVTLADTSYLLDGEIMSDATEDTPATIRGNIVNLYASILRGVFDTGDADFPLDFVSSASGTTSAPTGLGIPDAQLNFTQIKSERDTWHPSDVGQIVFTDPEDAKQHLEDEFFRVFQCWPAVSGDGLLGLRFHVPALPASAAPVLDDDNIVQISNWQRLYGDHMNKFEVHGDYDQTTDMYDTVLYNTETSEDTTDQSNTGETVRYLLESRWLRTDYDGVAIAAELAGRMRIRYLKTPAQVDVFCNFARRTIEEGDVVAVTNAWLPNLLDGTRGITAKLMTVISIQPDFVRGLMRFRLLDTGYKRYGVIGESAQPDYGSATDQEKNTFAWVGATSTNEVGSAEPGYRLI